MRYEMRGRHMREMMRKVKLEAEKESSQSEDRDGDQDEVDQVA